jgi:transcriptional regulator with XRE-family HTH domain
MGPAARPHGSPAEPVSGPANTRLRATRSPWRIPRARGRPQGHVQLAGNLLSRREIIIKELVHANSKHPAQLHRQRQLHELANACRYCKHSSQRNRKLRKLEAVHLRGAVMEPQPLSSPGEPMWKEAGAIVRAARLRAGITLADLGHRCGYSASQISRYERGVQPLTDVTLLRRFADALAIPPQLLGLADARDILASRHAGANQQTYLARVARGAGGQESREVDARAPACRPCQHCRRTSPSQPNYLSDPRRLPRNVR